MLIAQTITKWSYNPICYLMRKIKKKNSSIQQYSTVMMALVVSMIIWFGTHKLDGWLTLFITRSSLRLPNQENKQSLQIVQHNFQL